jgi:hypothetical protein
VTKRERYIKLKKNFPQNFPRHETPPKYSEIFYEIKEQTILEFLEGSLCGMVNKISTAVLYDTWSAAWISDCYDI